jgi:mRNA interferase HicA
MKRRALIRHLQEHGCELLREGSRHSVYVNRAAKAATSVPRHTDIDEFLCLKICKDLQIPKP